MNCDAYLVSKDGRSREEATDDAMRMLPIRAFENKRADSLPLQWGGAMCFYLSGHPPESTKPNEWIVDLPISL